MRGIMRGWIVSMCMTSAICLPDAQKPLHVASAQTDISPNVGVADPVDALLLNHPELEEILAAPRLLRVGETVEWMTEGDKLRLRKERTRFADYTDVELPPPRSPEERATPHTPPLSHHTLIRPLFPNISLSRMNSNLSHFTSFFNRYYNSIHGVHSAEWLYSQIANTISKFPASRVSLRWHTHKFAQSSIIARFEPPACTASMPVTIISAHQDSVNWDDKLLPAPGAVDDGSGSISILEAFRVLLESGYVPKRGPVEFHWYAAEEDGLLGSLDIAKYYHDRGVHVGATLQFDMTAFVSRRPNTTEHIGIISTETDPDLTAWIANLGEEYLDIPVRVHTLGAPNASDHSSWYNLGYPAAGADQQDGKYSGGFRRSHTEHDRMDIDDDEGYFSIDHMARFAELAIAYVVEQASWGKYPEAHIGY